MDLNNVETYLRPQTIADLGDWQPGWAWLAGGTWLFSEAQPQLTTLVDLQGLGWPVLEITPEGLGIGATCTMSQLLNADYPEQWTAVHALHSAVHELASFKVQNVATVTGNLCVALPAGTFAPVMVALDARYEILSLDGRSRWVPALEFQTGAKQTILQPGELLRQVWIPAASLEWQVNYQRICIASFGLAIVIVVTAFHPSTQRVRFGIGACMPTPRLLTFDQVPNDAELIAALDAHLSPADYITDLTATATYRRHITQVLLTRSLQAVTQPR